MEIVTRHDPIGETRRPAVWLPVASLWWREVVRFYRQPSRVIGGLGSPLVFWLLIGSGIGSSFRGPAGLEQANYLEFFFPGTLTMILLFTAIFSTVSVIEDRREGFLQGVMVAPISRSAIVLSKILGGTTLAGVQGLVFLMLSPVVGVRPALLGWLLAVAMIFMIAFALTGLGFVVAWPMESTQGFHSVMNLFLLPLWLLSGSLFPASGAAAAIQGVMRLNPLSYGVDGLRTALYWPSPAGPAEWRSYLSCMVVTTVFCAMTFAASVYVAHSRGGGGK
jgi:ABC-2 type transport system permease protein